MMVSLEWVCLGVGLELVLQGNIDIVRQIRGQRPAYSSRQSSPPQAPLQSGWNAAKRLASSPGNFHAGRVVFLATTRPSSGPQPFIPPPSRYHHGKILQPPCRLHSSRQRRPEWHVHNCWRDILQIRYDSFELRWRWP